MKETGALLMIIIITMEIYYQVLKVFVVAFMNVEQRLKEPIIYTRKK